MYRKRRVCVVEIEHKRKKLVLGSETSARPAIQFSSPALVQTSGTEEEEEEEEEECISSSEGNDIAEEGFGDCDNGFEQTVSDTESSASTVCEEEEALTPTNRSDIEEDDSARFSPVFRRLISDPSSPLRRLLIQHNFHLRDNSQ